MRWKRLWASSSVRPRNSDGWNETSLGKNENRLLVEPSSNVAMTSGAGSNMPSGMGRGIGEMMALMIFMEWFVLVSWGRWKEVSRHKALVQSAAGMSQRFP